MTKKRMRRNQPREIRVPQMHNMITGGAGFIRSATVRDGLRKDGAPMFGCRVSEPECYAVIKFDA